MKTIKVKEFINGKWEVVEISLKELNEGNYEKKKKSK